MDTQAFWPPIMDKRSTPNDCNYRFWGDDNALSANNHDLNTVTGRKKFVR